MTDWKRVPVEPTEEMVRAWVEADADYSNSRYGPHPSLSRPAFVYRAVLAAAPAAPDGEEAQRSGRKEGGWTIRRTATRITFA